MDKRVTAQGIIRVQNRNDKKPGHHLKSASNNETIESFEINTKEFPSLNEISNRTGNQAKNPLDCNKSFSYSEKLKKTPTEPRSCLQLESSYDASYNSAFVGEYSSQKSKASYKSGTHRRLVHSDNSDNKVPLKGSHFSGRISNQERATSKTKSSDKCHVLNNPDRKYPSQRYPNEESILHRATEDKQASRARSEMYSKENAQKMNLQMCRKSKSIASDKTHDALNSQFILSRAENIKTIESLPSTVPSTSKNKSTGNVPSFQIAVSMAEQNYSKLYSNDKTVTSREVDLHPAEVKKKKKRKSKIKRQAAMQTGKIFVLTPEAHSKLLNQSNVTNSKQNKNVVVNINDSEEYPELGTSSVPITNKETTVKLVEITSKNAVPVSDKNDIVNLETNLSTSNPISAIQGTSGAVVENVETNVKPSDNEKIPVLKKDPITVSLFDMLLTAKSRKKETEKKNELVIQDSLIRNMKPLSKVLGKKGVSYAVNPLDSSRPAIKRGKEREKPKVKKPSRMRKLILMGRQLRKEEMTTFDESEKNDISYSSHSDDCQSPSKLIDSSFKNEFDLDINCDTENILYTEDDDFESRASSSEENNSIITFSNEVCQSHIRPSKSTNYSKKFSNDCVAEIYSETKSIETKASDVVLTADLAYLKELEENESSDKESLNTNSPIDCSSHELVLNHFKELDGQTFKTLIPHDCISDKIECVSENILVDANDENHGSDILVENSTVSVLVEEKCIVSDQPNCKSYNALIDSSNLFNQSFSEDNDTAHNRLNKVEESPNASILNMMEKVNISNISTHKCDLPLKTEASSSLSSNYKDASSFSSNLNIEESLSFNLFHENENLLSSSTEDDTYSEKFQEKGDISESDLNEKVSCVDFLSKEMENISDEEKTEAVKIMIHSRKFRKYCNHFISKEIDEVVFALLDDLARFQDRMHQKDPVKARVRKRLLYGIKEIKRHMKLKKLKGIIIATNIEDIKTEGGLNDVIDEIISLAEAYHIPYIFSHRRFNLGKVCRKGVPVSCVGIFNYEGSEKNFKRIIELQEESKHDYINVTKALDAVLSYNEIADVLKLEKGVPEKLYEVRTKILREHFKPNTNQGESELNVPKVSINSTESIDDSKDSYVLFQNNSNWCTETDNSAPKEMNENAIYDILMKYNLV